MSESRRPRGSAGYVLTEIATSIRAGNPAISNDTLAEKTGYTRVSVQRAIRRLIDDGYIVIVQRGRAHHATEYALTKLGEQAVGR